MRIVITGAGGFIGSNLIPSLSAKQLTLATTTPLNIHGCQELRGDLTDRLYCKELVSRADCVVHLAHAFNGPVQSIQNFDADIDLNLRISENMISELSSRRNVHVVFASSGGAVYAPSMLRTPYLEDDRTEPVTPYAIHKLFFERYLGVLAQRRGVTSNILRVGNPYGDLMSQSRRQGIIGIALNNYFENRPVKIFGNPMNVRDYVYIEDVVRAFVAAVDCRNGCQVFNIGTGVGHSVANLIEIIGRVIGRPLLTETSHEEGETCLNDWCVLNNAKAGKILGWTPDTSLTEGIGRMLARVKANRQIVTRL